MNSLVQHLGQRHLDLKLHRPALGDNVATFWLYNLSGQIVGYQQYRPHAEKSVPKTPREARYFSYVTAGNLAVWGLESLHLGDTVFVCEGLFDACRFTELGYPALATLCNNPSTSLQNLLFCLPKRLVVVCDNDHAGAKLSKVSKYVETSAPYKDVGEAPEAFVESLVRKYYP